MLIMKINMKEHPPEVTKSYLLDLKHYEWVCNKMNALEKTGIMKKPQPIGQSIPIIKTKRTHWLKAQTFKDVILGSSPSVNRKLLTHILTNIPNHPPHMVRGFTKFHHISKGVSRQFPLYCVYSGVTITCFVMPANIDMEAS